MNRIAAARRVPSVAIDLRNDIKPRYRMPMERISTNRFSLPQEPDRPIKPISTAQSTAVLDSLRPLPFKHVEIPIGNRSDPQDVAEFENIIYRGLRDKENAMRPLRFNQTEITLKDRNCLVDATSRIHYKLTLTTNTLYRFIGILDRYLSVAQVKPAKLKVVGCACFLIASKIEDIYPAQSKDLIPLADRSFTQQDLFACEIQVINAIQFDTTFATPLFYLSQFMRISDPCREALLLARYLLELCQTSERIFGVAPALVAAAAVMGTRILRGQERWTKKLAGYTAFSADDLDSIWIVIHTMLLERDREESRFIRRKYGQDLFLCVANIRVPTRF
jgi:hypothetical protein